MELAPAFTPRPLRRDETPGPGDILIEHSKGWVGKVIRFGGGRDGSPKRADVNHSGVIVGEDVRRTEHCPEYVWVTVEAYMGKGNVRRERRDLTGYVIRLSDDPAVRARVAEVAVGFEGLGYDNLQIAWCAARMAKARWWARPLGILLAAVLPKADDPSKVICSDVTRQVIEKTFAVELLAYPSWQTAPIDLLRALNGWGYYTAGTNGRR